MREFPRHSFKRAGDETPCEWLIEPLRARSNLFIRRTFGCWSFYLGEKNVLLYEPARGGDAEGLLIPSSQEFHAELIKEFPQLTPHCLLKKWLYISASTPDYEETANAIISLILAGDRRIGVLGKIRKNRTGKTSR